MCDSDDDNENGEPDYKGIDLTGFLFGNINEKGQLEDDGLLDGESKRMLSSLGRLGFGSLLAEMIESPERSDDHYDIDYDAKSPGAVDYSDINELAEEQSPQPMQAMDEINEFVIEEPLEENMAAVASENNNLNIPQNEDGQDYVSETNDEGYEGDMEGDGELMPPPSTIPGQEKRRGKRLETPLAAMLPSKYVDTDVTYLFPDFRPDKVLRFSRLFGPGKASSLPQIWRGVRRRRRRTSSDPPLLDSPNILELESDDEEKYLRPVQEQDTSANDSKSNSNNSQNPTPAHWRFGPAQVWYDMLQVPESGEGFNYGFKLKSTPSSPKREEKTGSPDSGVPDEAYLMVSQLQWEDDVVWDGNEIKHKVMARLNSKTNAAGWLPTSGNRTAQQFSHPTRAPLAPPPPPQPPKQQPGTSGSQASSTNAAAPEDDTWYSIFPVENEELVYGTWEDDVIWDAEAMLAIPQPKILTLDPNDENIVLGIPDDVDPSKIHRERGPQPKVKIPHPHVKKSKLLLGKAGVINVLQEDAPPPPPKSPDRDPFNISNDVFYMARSSTLRLKVGGGQLIQHSTPIVELRVPFVQTHMGPVSLRAFHRPALKKLPHGPGPHPVLPLIKHIKKKAKQREAERLASGGGDVFFMRTPDDLSGRDGDLILVEFCEEHPPLISQVGMCSKIKNYYKRLTGKDPGPKPFKYGEVAFAHTSPFLGILPPGQTQQVIENNMYRAPIYGHTVPPTDFLVIRNRLAFFIREIDDLFVAGQECPLYEVPGPNSKRANNFVRDFLQVFIYRLFWKSRDNPRRIKMDDIKKAFPSHSESSIRKRLKLCADFKRTGNDSNWWVIKPEFRLPSEEEIRAMVSPEQCCAYFSMASAEQRLKDAGYGEKFIFAQQEDDDEEMQLKMDDEVKVAPWNTTRAYIQAMRGKCLLQLTGPADPTGCGEGFSYVRVPNKPTQTKEEVEQQPKRTVTGTDADLRRLSLNNAKALLRKFGVPDEEIKKLSRWEVIDVVRTLSTEKAKAGEEGMTKFSRGNRFSIAEHQERYKEECQRIFELQNRVLSSTEVLSTDEAESSVTEESDLEEMGKNLENMLANKKTTEQLSLEREEAERAELRKMILGGDKKSIQRTDDQSQQPSQSAQGRILRIVRTFRNPAGNLYTRSEIVRKPAVIEAYTKIRTTKDDSFIKQFATLDDAQKEEMKREKRRIQEQLRRIKRNQERERLAGNAMPSGFSPGSSLGFGGSGPGTPEGLIPYGSIKQEDGSSRRRAKLKPDLKLKCGACGQVGHMRTNKACPLWRSGGLGSLVTPSGSSGPGCSGRSVALTEEQEEEIERRMLREDDEDLVNVEGTKVTLSGKLLKHAEEMKRRTMMLRVPRDAMDGGVGSGNWKRRRRGGASGSADNNEYLVRRPAARRRTDPLVTLSSLLEDVLNDMRHLPDVQPFLFPVNAKQVPDYYRIVSRPMDLQSIRESLRQKRYQSREDFLADVNQIVENSNLYNGVKSSLTVAAHRMLQRCVERLAENEEQMMKLEKAINPLLDDNDQVALSFILENLLTTKLKIMPEAWPFLKPVNKKQVKDYYNVIKHPIDMETMGKKIQAHKYHSRNEFLQDIQLLADNCRAYNGPQSQFTLQAEAILAVTQEALNQFGEHVIQLEKNIARVQEKMREEALTLGSGGSEGEAGPHDGQPEGDEMMGFPPDGKRGRGRPRKHKLSTPGSEGLPKKPRGRPRTITDQNCLEDDLHCSGSDGSDFEEVDPTQQQDAAEAMVQLSSVPFYHHSETSVDIDPNYDPSDFLIKREVTDDSLIFQDHPPQPSMAVPVSSIDDQMPIMINDNAPEPTILQNMEYSHPALIKEEPVHDLPGDPEMFKEERSDLMQQWHQQGERAIQDDLQVTDSEEEPEEGLWF